MGFRHVPNKEWGRKHRKEEDRMRGLNNQDRRRAVAEQVFPPEVLRDLDVLDRDRRQDDRIGP